MKVADFLESLVNDYIEGFKIKDNLDKTPQEIGIDSLDLMEMYYYIGEKFDLRKKIPENFKFGDIISYLGGRLPSNDRT